MNATGETWEQCSERLEFWAWCDRVYDHIDTMPWTPKHKHVEYKLFLQGIQDDDWDELVDSEW